MNILSTYSEQLINQLIKPTHYEEKLAKRRLSRAVSLIIWLKNVKNVNQEVTSEKLVKIIKLHFFRNRSH